jgi:hypothetical protein
MQKAEFRTKNHQFILPPYFQILLFAFCPSDFFIPRSDAAKPMLHYTAFCYVRTADQPSPQDRSFWNI